MAKDALFTLKLDGELRDRFMAEAAATHQSASQIVREFMRDFVQRQSDARGQDALLRTEIEQGLIEARDPQVKRIPHEEVASKWLQQRDDLVKRAGESRE